MENNRTQSEFNMAVSYLNRLNALFYVADEASMQLDIYTWFHSLMTLFRELSTEMNAEELENLNRRLQAVNPLIQRAINMSKNKGNLQVDEKLYGHLNDIEISLRRICKDAGLQQKMMDDATKALK